MSWCVRAAQLGAAASGFGGGRALRQLAVPEGSSLPGGQPRKQRGHGGVPTPGQRARTDGIGAIGVGARAASAVSRAVTATPPGHTSGVPARRFMHSSLGGTALRANELRKGESRSDHEHASGAPRAAGGGGGEEGGPEEDNRGSASRDQEMFELRFGELLGEDPVRTRAKILARRKNPDLTLVDVEKQVGGKGKKELQAMFSALTQQQRQKQQEQLLRQSQQQRRLAQGGAAAASPGTPPAPPPAQAQVDLNLSAPPARPKEAIFLDPSSSLRLQSRPGAPGGGAPRRPGPSAGAPPVAVRKPQVLQSGRLTFAELPPEVDSDEEGVSVIQPMKMQRRAQGPSGPATSGDTSGPTASAPLVSERPRPTASLPAAASPTLARPAPPLPPSAPPLPVAPRPTLALQVPPAAPLVPTVAPEQLPLEPAAAAAASVPEAQGLQEERRGTGSSVAPAPSAEVKTLEGETRGKAREAEGAPAREVAVAAAPRLQQSPRAPVIPMAAPPRPAPPPRPPAPVAPAASQPAKRAAREAERGQGQGQSQAIPLPGRAEEWSEGVQDAMRRAVARERQEAALLERLRGSGTVTSQGGVSDSDSDTSVSGGEGAEEAQEQRDAETQTPVTNFVERGTAAQLAQEASSAPSAPRSPPLRPSRPPPAPSAPPLKPPPGAPAPAAAGAPAAYPPIPQLSVASPPSLAPRLSLRNSRPDSDGTPLLPPKPKEAGIPAPTVPVAQGGPKGGVPGKGAPGAMKPKPFVPAPTSDPALASAIAELQELAKKGDVFEVEAVQVASGGIRVMYKNVPAFVPSVLLSLKRGLPAYEAWCACNSDAILAEARREGRLPPAAPTPPPQPESEADALSQSQSQLLSEAGAGFPEAQGSAPPPAPSVVSLVEAGAARAILVEAYQALRLRVFQETLGKKMRVVVAHMNARGTFILSEKDAERKDPEGLKYRQELMKTLRVGEEVTCKVLNLMRYGVLVELRGTTAFISYSDSPWPTSKVDPKGQPNAMEMLEIGKEYEASIARLDFSSSRIYLTMGKGDVVLDALDQLLQQRPFAGAREAEAVVRMLREHPGVVSASVAPHRTSSVQVPAFQIYLSAPVERGFTLLACSENEQQEIFVETSMDKDAMRDLIQAAITRLQDGAQ